jgi:hypothetical protein
MEIKKVTRKIVVTITGVEHIHSEENWTQSIKDAQKSGIEFEKKEDIFDWLGLE